jgi:hypothetical protein
MTEQHVWELRHPEGGVAGHEFARAVVAPTESLLVHSAPPRLAVRVRVNDGEPIAVGEDLRATDDTPMTRLRIDGLRVVRQDLWPDEDELDQVVVMPGGEAGRLRSWSAAPDRRAWTWTVEFRGGR